MKTPINAFIKEQPVSGTLPRTSVLKDPALSQDIFLKTPNILWEFSYFYTEI